MSMQDERNQAYEIVRKIGAVDFIDAIIKLYACLPDVTTEVIVKPELIRESIHECRNCGNERSLNSEGCCSRCWQVWNS